MKRKLKNLAALWLAVIMAVTLVMPMAAAEEQYTKLKLRMYCGSAEVEVDERYGNADRKVLNVYGNGAQIIEDGTNVKENTLLWDTWYSSTIDSIESNTGKAITGWTLWGGELASGFLCQAELGDIEVNPTVGDIMDRIAASNYPEYMLAPKTEPYAITHQPTSSEPYVGVNSTNGVSYQWYGGDPEAENDPVDVTDKGDDPYFGYCWSGYFDQNEEVWISGMSRHIGTGYGVDVELTDIHPGDTITITIVEGDTAGINVYDYDNLVIYAPSTDKKTWTAVIDSPRYSYNPIIEVPAGETVKAKIEVTRYNIVALTGETGRVLSDLKEGYEYYCQVSWWNSSNSGVIATKDSDSFIYKGEDGDRSDFWPWLLLLTRAVRYYDGEELLHTARAWKENPLEAVYEPEAREGYTFAGWYTDTEYTETFDFTEPLLASHRVYAKWVPSTEGNIEQ